MNLRFIRPVVLFIAIIVPSGAQSQSIKGKITDAKNAPVPFVVVYDETTLSGTTANDEGYYELKLDSGRHSLVFKAMGYFLLRKNIEIQHKPVEFDVVLSEQPVQVKEVIIRPGKEDPAYAIMRKVIGLAPYHLNQVKQYVANVYLRGTAHIIKMPKFISKRTAVNGEPAMFKTGDVYMEESVNMITFTAPDNYEQKVISIKSTFPWNSDDINPMGLINSSLYEPKVEDFISPLAPKAFQYYNYKYEGFIEEGGQVIFKIAVIPKHNSQQLMRGTLFIVDRLWCLHSADVAVNMFFGSLKYKTIYSPVKNTAWLPVSYQFSAEASMMGIKASFNYASSVKFNEVVLNAKNAEIRPVKEPSAEVAEKTAPKTKNQQQIESLLSKEDLSNRDVVKLSALMAREASQDTVKEKSLEIKPETNHTKVIVEKSAINSDSAYWNSVRPIPLSKIESQVKPVSKAAGKQSSGDTISLGINTNKKDKPLSKVSRFLTQGAGFMMFDSTLHIQYEGLIGFKKIDYNTVDGFVYKQTFKLQQTIDSTHKIIIQPGVSYGFSRERFMWWTKAHYEYAPMRGGNLTFYIASQSADYNGESGIHSLVNTGASLLFRRNYLKVYQQNLVYLENKLDLANGLNLKAQIGYRTAQPLRNHSDFSFFYRNTRDFSANIPGDRLKVLPRNLYNEEAYWDATIEYTPQYHYRIWGGTKHYQYSKFPTFYIRNRMALPGIVKSTADYDYLEAGIRQNISWQMMHSFSWNIQGGIFINRDKIYAMDDKFFNNQDLPLIFSSSAKGAFRLLPFYKFAVTDKYAEAHLEYSTPYLLFKYLPFLSNKLWVENLHLNYLAGGGGLHYWEAGYSMGQIYMIANVGVFAGFNRDMFRSWGIQVTLTL
jgi:hypothetical protein